MYLISQYGVDFGTGYAIEFTGETIRSLSMEARMTICNMAIEAGAKYGLMQPDEMTFAYVKDKNMLEILTVLSMIGVNYILMPMLNLIVIKLDVTNLEPQVTWGTNPEMGVSFNTPFPKIKNINDERAYQYMGLKPGQKAEDIDLGYVFLGSCTNARLSDLVEASRIVKGKQVHPKSLQSLYLALAQLKRS